MIGEEQRDSEARSSEPEPDARISALFGSRPDGVALAHRYAELLSTIGIEHGVIGPRESDRIWDRHLLNCAAIAELLPLGSRVVDVGSGAGLPGIAIACARADLSVTLLEPLERRVRFLTRVVDELGLAGQLAVVRGRAGSRDTERTLGRGPFATARAVAPLGRLAQWCLPLLEPGGALLALKGRTAQQEVAESLADIRAANGEDVQVRLCGVAVLREPVGVVVVRKAAGVSTSV